jgi:hypothetical protein
VNQIATMQWVQERTSIPVPKILAYELDHSHALGAHIFLEKARFGFSALQFVPLTVAFWIEYRSLVSAWTKSSRTYPPSRKTRWLPRSRNSWSSYLTSTSPPSAPSFFLNDANRHPLLRQYPTLRLFHRSAHSCTRASTSKAAPRSRSTAALSQQRVHTSSLALSASVLRPARFSLKVLQRELSTRPCLQRRRISSSVPSHCLLSSFDAAKALTARIQSWLGTRSICTSSDRRISSSHPMILHASCVLFLPVLSRIKIG